MNIIPDQVSERIDNLLYTSKDNILKIQSLICPHVKDISVSRVYEYSYRGVRYPVYENNTACVISRDIPIVYSSIAHDSTFIGTMSDLVEENRVNPFFIFFNGCIIKWSDTTIIHDISTDYIKITNTSANQITNTITIFFIGLPKNNLRYGEDDNILLDNEKHLYFNSDGKLITNSTDDVATRIEFIDCDNLYFSQIDTSSYTTDTDLIFTNLPDGYIPSIDNNIILFSNENKLVHNTISEDTSYVTDSFNGIYGIFSFNRHDVVNTVILMYNMDGALSSSSIYTRSDSVNKSSIISTLKNSDSSYDYIRNYLKEHFNLSLSGDGYKALMESGIDYITKYDYSLWNKVLEENSNVKSYSYTGAKFKALSSDSKYVNFSRRIGGSPAEAVGMMFVNSILTHNSDAITINSNSIIFPISGIYDDDHIEILIFTRCNNLICNISVTSKNTPVYINPEYDLRNCDIMSEICANPDYPSTPDPDGRTQYICDIKSYSKTKNNEYYIEFEDNYYGYDLTIVPKRQFRHYKFNNCNNRSIFLLPLMFNYCHDINKYLIFINGYRIEKSGYIITIPGKHNPYTNIVLKLGTILDTNDYLDVYYVPESLEEKYLESQATNEGYIFLSDPNNYPYKYSLSKNTSMLFINGLKINPLDIKDLTMNSMLVNTGLLNIYNVAVLEYQNEIETESVYITPRQMLDKSNIEATVTRNGVTFTNNGDGTITIDGTSTAQTDFSIATSIKFIPNHVYAIYKDDGTSTDIEFGQSTYGVFDAVYGNIIRWTYTSNEFTGPVIIRINPGKTIENKTVTPQIFDLTDMFGKGNEPVTLSSFRTEYPDDYYPYLTGGDIITYEKADLYNYLNGVIPDAYKPLDYLISSANINFNIENINIENGDTVYAHIYSDDTSSRISIVEGELESESFELYTDSNWKLKHKGQTLTSEEEFTAGDNEIYIINGKGIVINDSYVDFEESDEDFSTDGNQLKIFKPECNDAKFYRFFIKKSNGEYKLNLIPVIRVSDSIVGVYDTISKTFINNGALLSAGNIIEYNNPYDNWKNFIDTVKDLYRFGTKDGTKSYDLYRGLRLIFGSIPWAESNYANVLKSTFLDAIDTLTENDITLVKHFERSSSVPSSGITFMDISEDGSAPVYLWFTDSTLYYYTDADKMRFNKICGLFEGFSGLIDVNGLSDVIINESTINELDGNIKGLDDLFRGCISLTNISGASSLNISTATSAWNTFYNCSSLINISALSNWDTSNITNMTGIFIYCSKLTDISGLSNWNTSNVTSMNNLFNGCSKLSDISPLSNWNASNVTSMSNMFGTCTSLIDISGLSNWDISKVTNINGLFNGCIKLSNISGLSNWNTISLYHMTYAFNGCTSLSDISPLSNWYTNNVSDITNIFYGCTSLHNLSYIKYWNTNTITNMKYAFYNVGGSNGAEINELRGFDLYNDSGTVKRIVDGVEVAIDNIFGGDYTYNPEDYPTWHPSYSREEISTGDKPSSTSVLYYYDGTEKTNGYITPGHVDCYGTTKATNAGTYKAKYVLHEGYKWSDNTNIPVTVWLFINPAKVTEDPPGSSISKAYNGYSQSNDYTCPTGINVEGSTSGTDVGTYTATYTPDDNYEWSTLGKVSKSRSLYITQFNLDNVTMESCSSYTYDGYSKLPKPKLSLSSGYVLVEGTDFYYTYENNVNAGTAKVTAVGKGNFTGYKLETFIINPLPSLTKPPASVTKTYTGLIQSNGYTKPASVDMEGTDTATDIGNYVATYTPKSNFAWTDGTTSTQTCRFSIIGISVGAKPTATTVTATYTGESKSNGYITPDHVTMTGVRIGTNAGTYVATYTPDENYIWSDGTNNTITVTLIINKAAGNIISPTPIAGLVYTGEYQELITEGSSTTGTVYYKLGASGIYYTTIPTAKNIGIYNVYYYSKGDDNHNDTSESFVVCSIS